MLDLSISIVNWNTRELLKKCLKSIYQNTQQIKYEIFVVDNASIDHSVEMVKSDFPQVNIIKNKENVGFSKANNQAFKKSKGRYFLLLNSDIVVFSYTFDRMVEFMDLHPEVGIVGCKLLNPDGTFQYSCGEFHSISKILISKIIPVNNFTKKWLSKYLLHYWDFSGVREVDWVTGACLMAKREAINEVGLLDENIFMYFEDNDWCYRMKKKGWKVYFIPQATVLHLGGQSIKKVYEKIAIESLMSKYYFYRKHYGRVRLWMLKMLQILNSMLKIGFGLFIYICYNKKDKQIKEMLNIYKEVIRLSFTGKCNKFRKD